MGSVAIWKSPVDLLPSRIWRGNATQSSMAIPIVLLAHLMHAMRARLVKSDVCGFIMKGPRYRRENEWEEILASPDLELSLKQTRMKSSFTAFFFSRHHSLAPRSFPTCWSRPFLNAFVVSTSLSSHAQCLRCAESDTHPYRSCIGPK